MLVVSKLVKKGLYPHQLLEEMAMTIIILLQIALLSIGTMFQWAYQLRDELATLVK